MEDCCRVKTALLTGASTHHDSVHQGRTSTLAQNAVSLTVPAWSEHNWWEGLSNRNDESNLAHAKLFYTFCRAYVVSVMSAAAEGSSSVLRATATEMLQLLRESQSATGVVSVGALVESFRLCPVSVFTSTLSLLAWAGHVGTPRSMKTVRWVIFRVVSLYWCGQQVHKRIHDAEVCHCLVGCLRLMQRSRAS